MSPAKVYGWSELKKNVPKNFRFLKFHEQIDILVIIFVIFNNLRRENTTNYQQ